MDDNTIGEVEISNTGDSFKDVVMSQLRKITNFFNTEYRGGYYSTIETKNGNEKEVYVQDSREVLCNSIHCLALILRPKFEKAMQEYFPIFETKLKKLSDVFIEATSCEEEVILGEGFYENVKDKILLETYRNKKLALYIELFDMLSKELSAKNYLSFMGGTF